jgi:hypothetical protein
MSVYAHNCDNIHVPAPPDKTTVELNPTAMIQQDGLWVHTNELPAGFDILTAVQNQHEERLGNLAR